MLAQVDKDLCISCELCPDICPEVFEIQDDGLAGTIMNDVPEDYQDAVQEAASSPTEAIRAN